jgi:predicted amidohydrolase YtcJ
MARLGLTLSCGAKEIDDQGWFIPKIFGERYANRIGPMNSTFKAGVRVALEETNADGLEDPAPTTFSRVIPFMTRLRSDGMPIALEEAINRVQLMKMMTTNAAWYLLKEEEAGSLEPGKLADFVVLNKDYFTVPDAEIPTVYPLMTVIGGKTIVLRQELAQELGVSAVGPQLNFVYEAEGRGATRDPWIPPDEYLTNE